MLAPGQLRRIAVKSGKAALPEGARVGSALATGDVDDCTGGDDPSLVDATLVSAVQRILNAEYRVQLVAVSHCSLLHSGPSAHTSFF